jgi:NAD(P)-dependent dehydrogenase (short-subunit alcohol dehydrogenase family)
MDPRTDLDGAEKRKFVALSELELRPLGRAAPSQSLYQLRYPGSFTLLVYLIADNFLYSTDGPTENWRKIIYLNVLGLSVCTKAALQSMKERGVNDGHIIHINRFVRKITRV